MRYFLCLMFVANVLAQGSGPDDPPPDDPIPPTPPGSTLPGGLGSGVNYTAYVPRHTGDFVLINLGRYSGAIALAVEKGNQTHIEEALLAPGESVTLYMADFGDPDAVHLLSLQPFAAIPSAAPTIAGIEMSAIPVRAPSIHLKIREATLGSGVKCAVGVDRQGWVHFPFFAPGRAVGRWSVDRREAVWTPLAE